MKFDLQNLFDCLKRNTADKVAHNKRTGVTLKPYSDLDNIMIDIEGRDSNKMVGLGLADNSARFSNQTDMSNLSILNTSSQSQNTPTVFVNPSTTPANVILAVAGEFFKIKKQVMTYRKFENKW